jgi:16S rRNA G1207 methylase RsmC
MLIRALCDLKVREIQRVAVFKPGQGHVAVATWKILRPAFIELIDRDLLALRYSRLNLIKNGCPPEKINLSHQVGVEPTGQEKYDLIAGFPGEEGRQAMFLSTRQAVERLSPGGSLIVAGGSTAMARLADRVKSEGELRIKARERRRGYSLLALEKVL